ncbi:hypothetical protein HID58_093869 [Brassica napus]|uniref:Uncharacterized protein n=1 Tax=Brassica napus TaxID=3708 RepID=A0ABQ7X9H6_BRANA|nr:hypothetical protein HID58_093869 [Brassica napus]
MKRGGVLGMVGSRERKKAIGSMSKPFPFTVQEER